MIWFTDQDADEAANHLCDKHLRPAIQFARKAVAEARENRTQQNCPYLRWACESRQNLKWTIDHAYGASQELYLRFRKNAKGGDMQFLIKASAFVGWIIDAPITRTPFPDDIEKVRDRYRTEISPKSKWTKRYPPDWLVG
tara:strand:- start:169 stop:588 length:420 start_codon:yes stop_codon:yes gene_type:complete